jgi:hypothetical protein
LQYEQQCQSHTCSGTINSVVDIQQTYWENSPSNGKTQPLNCIAQENITEKQKTKETRRIVEFKQREKEEKKQKRRKGKPQTKEAGKKLNLNGMNFWGQDRNRIAGMVLVQLHWVKVDEDKLPYSSEIEWSLFNCLQLKWQKDWVPLQAPLLKHLSWNQTLWTWHQATLFLWS